MPSPFPGMDPYLENPNIWPDFHDALAGAIRNELNRTLPAPFYARLEMRPEVGIVEEGGHSRRIVPDVAVMRPPKISDASSGVALLDKPRTEISPSVQVTVLNESLRHAMVAIRDPDQKHRLVTLIEIASPSNKRSGPDRRAYLLKQQEVLQSEANLVELDLLREGDRLLADPALELEINRLKPVPDYLVLVNRSWLRQGAALDFQAFPIAITEPLPCIPVPLRQNQEEIPLDLQFVFQQSYDTGPYQRGAVDYSQPPLFTGDKTKWIEECVGKRLAK